MNKLESLAKSVEQHSALNNAFYDIWATERLNADKLKIVGINYLSFTKSFPRSLASLIANTADAKVCCEYTNTLFSEMGDGNSERIHSLLFENFFNELLLYVDSAQNQTLSELDQTLTTLPETEAFISGQLSLYSDNSAVAIGAQLALEWQAYTMISKLYEGARNYIDLWSSKSKFHEACEFFYIHLASAEKEHKHESLNAANRVIELGGRYENVEIGFNKHLDLIHNFWEGIAKALNI